MADQHRLRRSLHFVPGVSEKMFTKALTLSADALVLDLEDAVVSDRKAEARYLVTSWLKEADFGRQERMVRINPIDSEWGLEDIVETMEGVPDAYVLPKVRTIADVERVDAEISRIERKRGIESGAVGLILIASETPEGVLNLPNFTQCKRVIGLTWGAEDLATELGALKNRDESGAYLDVFRYCRLRTLLSARAGNVQPIDSVFVDIGDAEGLQRECRESAETGFTGKMTIHPNQIEIVNSTFSPSPEEVAQAQALVAAFEQAMARGQLAFEFNGQMVDQPHLTRAQRVLARAQ